MVRSLYAGISGLRNHQVSMDVIGNNISNVNTTGFKSGRVTFEESMAQMLQGASRPAGNAGGTNPLQIGLGMQVGSIDTMLTQGNLQTTGQITDLAIEGKAYFTYSNGSGNYYSRNGALQLDAGGYLVSPTNGFRLQGMTAASDGTYPVGTAIGDLRIPYGEKAPARATTEISYACNLDSDSEGLGTITSSNRFLTQSAANDPLTSLYDTNGNNLGIEDGDEIIVSVSGGTTQRIPVTATTTLTDLASSIQAYLHSQPGNPYEFVTVSATGGNLTINTLSATAPLNGLSISSSRSGSASYVSNAFSFPPTIAANSSSTVSGLRVPATANTALSNAFDASGNSLGLENGDVISINGSVGGETISTLQVPYSSTAGASSVTTLGDLASRIQQAFRLPQTDGTADANQSVSVNGANTDDDRLPDGGIVVRGQPETAFAITSVSISASNSDNDSTAPTAFNANLGFTESQTARDTGVHSTSIEVYDESGDAHTITTTFTHSGQPNIWNWEITTNSGEEILGGNRGSITFGQDGSPSAWTFDDGATAFSFDPMNGSNVVDINLNIGTPGSFKGITQFRSESTTAARDQDGYPMGKLSDISIDETGEISGTYTNGVSKAIAQIYVAEFNNPAGLLKVGDSMFTTSNNSGGAVLLKPGAGSTSNIKPGSLEMSNVDLASEFTNMITTQRGYQANARVITTSDSMLQELVQLIR